MGNHHWTELQAILNTTARTLGKEPRFLVIPDQRNTTMYRIYYGDKRQTLEVSEVDQFFAELPKLSDFVKQFFE